MQSWAIRPVNWHIPTNQQIFNSIEKVQPQKIEDEDAWWIDPTEIEVTTYKIGETKDCDWVSAIKSLVQHEETRIECCVSERMTSDEAIQVIGAFIATVNTLTDNQSNIDDA